MTLLTRQEVFEAIDKEREHQAQKYGEQAQSLPGFLLVAKKELDEAIDGWIANRQGRDSCLSEVLQVAAVCVAIMERYGINGNTFNTNDIPDVQGAGQYQQGKPRYP
jgi:hypothetical protein